MNSPILPVGGPSGPTIPDAEPTVAAEPGGFAAEAGEGARVISIAAARGGPPPEVLEQVAAAGAIEERMRAAGQRLRFLPAEPGERTAIELHDRHEDTVRALSLTEAFELAAGSPAGLEAV